VNELKRRTILRHAAYEVLSVANVMLVHVQHTLWKYALGDRGKLMLSDAERAYLEKSHSILKSLVERNSKFNDRLLKTGHYGNRPR
jgi:hypothetical protein